VDNLLLDNDRADACAVQPPVYLYYTTIHKG